jgi:hypothetical protein
MVCRMKERRGQNHHLHEYERKGSVKEECSDFVRRAEL